MNTTGDPHDYRIHHRVYDQAGNDIRVTFKHAHTWHRVPAHIATIASETTNEKSYNAACECGATEWVHWMPVKEEE